MLHFPRRCGTLTFWSTTVTLECGKTTLGSISRALRTPLVVEATTNFAVGSWVPLQICSLTNSLIYFSDVQWTNYAGRFYRIRSP
jgi:hypothetical protein